MDPVFVLTLADARERQAQVLAWGAAAGLDAGVFVAGVDLRRADAGFAAPAAAADRRRRRYGSPSLTLPEYGCLLGHHRIWTLMTQRDLAWALVLEDDAAPSGEGWWRQVQALAAQLLASGLGACPWIVHLAVDSHSRRTLALRPLRWRRPAAGDCPVIGEVDGRVGSLWTTTAYLIGREAARRMLADERDLPWVADDWEQRQRQGTVHPLLATVAPLFQAAPSLASQISSRSTPLPRAINRPRRKLLSLAYRTGLLARHC